MKMRFYYLLLVLTALSNFSFYLPYIILKYAKQGMPFAIAAGLLIAGINDYFQISIYNKYKNMDAVKINKKLFGKLFGTIITVIVSALNITTAAFIFAAGVKVVGQFLLFQTSEWYIILPCVSLLILIYRFKPKNYLYCKGFFTVLSFLWVVVLFAIGIKEMRFPFLTGTIIHSIRVPKLVSVAAAAFFFGGTAHLALFNPEFKEKISFKKDIIVQILVCLPILIMSVSIPLGIWGPEVVGEISFLQATTLDTMAVDMFFIERVLYIGIPLLVSLMFFNTQNFSYVAYNILKRLNPGSKPYAIGVEAGILIIFTYMSLKTDLDQLANGFEAYIKFWLFIYFAIQLLRFIFSKLEGRNKK